MWLCRSDGGADTSVNLGWPSEPRGQSPPGPCPAAGVGGGHTATPAPAQPFARAVGQCLVPASSIPAVCGVKSLFLLKGQLSWAPHWKERGTNPPASHSTEEGCSGASWPCAGPSSLLALMLVSPTSTTCTHLPAEQYRHRKPFPNAWEGQCPEVP